MAEVYDDNGNLVSSAETYDDEGNLVAASKSPSYAMDVLHSIASNPIVHRLISGPEDPEHKIQGPGLMKIPGLEKAGDWIRNKGMDTGNWYGGAAGSILGDLVSGASTGFDPRTAFPGHVGMPPVEDVPAITKPQLALPPAPPETTFIGGPSGGPGVVARPDVPPDIAMNIAGMNMHGRPGGSGSGFDTGVLGEENRIKNLKYDAAAQYPGTRLTIPDKGRQLPLESGDTTGGFSAQTPKEMQWPYNVIPNSLRPRAAQSEILGRTGLQGAELGTPVESGSDIHFISGGEDNVAWPTETKPDYYTGNPNLPAELPSAVKKPLDVVNGSPIDVKVPEDINKIPPGQADAPLMTNGKDISAFRAEATSPHIVMKNFPQTKSVLQPILNGQDEKLKWLATIEREASKLSDGLNSEDRKNLFYLMNGEEVPEASSIVRERAAFAKDLTDEVFNKAQDKNVSMGFQQRYVTHIAAQPDDIRSSIAAIIDRQFGKNSPLAKIFTSGETSKPTGKVGDILEKGLGNPESPFTKPRTDALQDIETDYNKVMPIYLESMAKSIFDRPAVDAAKDALKVIPEGKLKEYLQGHIRNYARYDADANLAHSWNALANQRATTNARSVIAFNPVVHMYHAGQLPANVWPELGTKYSSIGLGKFVSSPIEAYQELVKNGLFSNMIRPMRFQSMAERFDSASYYYNMVESIVKGTGYYGFKQKFLDMGMTEADATLKAIQETKNATATVDPARMMRFFTPESNIAGGQMMKLAKQYKQIPTKLIEQFSTAAADFKADKVKAARYVAGTAIAGAGTVAGIHTLHASPLSLMSEFSSLNPLGGQLTTAMTSAMKNLAKGDVASALGDIAAWAVPAGGTVKKMIQ